MPIRRSKRSARLQAQRVGGGRDRNEQARRLERLRERRDRQDPSTPLELPGSSQQFMLPEHCTQVLTRDPDQLESGRTTRTGWCAGPGRNSGTNRSAGRCRPAGPVGTTGAAGPAGPAGPPGPERAHEELTNYLWADVSAPNADIDTITWLQNIDPVVDRNRVVQLHVHGRARWHDHRRSQQRSGGGHAIALRGGQLPARSRTGPIGANLRSASSRCVLCFHATPTRRRNAAPHNRASDQHHRTGRIHVASGRQPHRRWH
jgi:hypothetical protein